MSPEHCEDLCPVTVNPAICQKLYYRIDAVPTLGGNCQYKGENWNTQCRRACAGVVDGR